MKPRRALTLAPCLPVFSGGSANMQAAPKAAVVKNLFLIPASKLPPQPNRRCQVQGFISTSTRISLFRLSQFPDRWIRLKIRSSLPRYCLCSMVGENPSRKEFDGFHCVLRVPGKPRSRRCAYGRAIRRGWRARDTRILFPLSNLPYKCKRSTPIAVRLVAWHRR